MKNSGKAIVSSFLGFRNQLKLFHWQTKSYAQHQAFGKAYDELSETIDEFLEVYIGKYARPFKDTDLLNLRDEMLQTANQLKYLLTLS